ncbi:adenylate kinase [Chlamydia vaughanii]|uniref:adenylate kinase n=1 Tax=Chlamydia vaughanii TaxID=3112552 RepID=UPI0032B1F360
MLKDIFYIIMGPPGSGKGTQSKLLANKLGIPHLSSGDLFRAAIKSSTPLGIKAQKYIDMGQLVPDVLVWELIEEKLNQPECLSGCIIDGFPRTLDQAVLLNDFMVNRHLNYHVIQLDVSEEEVTHRIQSRFICPSCNSIYNQKQGLGQCSKCHVDLIRRSDDTSEVIIQRLKSYRKSTEPLINYYQKLGKLTRIPSKPSPEEVFDNILDCIET